ncbi:kelch-like protein 6 [Drosophila teissieri]|uniref:kelch-like protein 6 n=1 Tax=Drosophila teissieri TaxID=7243 RepID=UPI001CB9DD1B|nr:kelch-like protein 6 [Drosophila teissieri]
MSWHMLSSSSVYESSSGHEVEDELDLCIEKETRDEIIKSITKTKDESVEKLTERGLEEMGFLEVKEDIRFKFGCSRKYMIDGITDMLENRICTDLQIQVGDRTFHCHLAILQESSNYFLPFKQLDVVTLDPNVVTPRGFEMAYHWITHKNAKLERKHIVEIYLTASHLDMTELNAHIWSRLDNPKLLNGLEAFKLYLECLPFQASVLQDLMLGRIHKYFLLAVATQEYLDLEPNHVCQMLGHINMCVNSEMEMFMSGVRWLFHDWPKRKKFAVTVMQAIRFNLMPSWYITSLKTPQWDAQFQELLHIPAVKSMIDLGLSFAITHNFLDPTSPLKEPLHMQKPLERQWVYHASTRHHHRYECSKWRYLTLEVFHEYLHSIIAAGHRYVPSLEYVKPGQMMECCQEALEKKSLNK